MGIGIESRTVVDAVSLPEIPLMPREPYARSQVRLLNPFCPTTFTVVLAPEPPSKSVTVPAEVVSPNVGVGTVNCIVVIAETEPETPCTVRPYTPGIAEFDGVSVSALVLVVLTGLNDAVMPAGNPEMFNTTEPARFAGLTSWLRRPQA